MLLNNMKYNRQIVSEDNSGVRNSTNVGEIIRKLILVYVLRGESSLMLD